MAHKDWYSPGEIRFTREEIIWLIIWLPLLEEGRWPSEHKETGYTGSYGTRGHRAPFENPSGFAGEINVRLKSTGEAGEALVDEIQDAITHFEGLSRPAQRALNYMSGWRRRKETYPQWKATQKYRGILP